VGREQELGQLQRWFEKAVRGERQVVFVTGEPGIGKTTLGDLFQEWLHGQQQVWVGRGQGVEQYGEGEAYLPILEAIGELARGPGSVYT
jgi:predicted ATPase